MQKYIKKNPIVKNMSKIVKKSKNLTKSLIKKKTKFFENIFFAKKKKKSMFLVFPSEEMSL